MPKVTIVIPVYNGANYLKEAINSALSQTYEHIEVLVINDGSNDNRATESIALAYGTSIRYIEKENGGVSTALNVGIKEMTGQYFSWLSHDDVYKPNKIQDQIEYLHYLGDETAIIYGGYEIINQKSKKIDVIDFLKLYPEPQLNKSLFPIFRGLANGCTMLIHRSHFDRVGLFDETLRTTQDYDLWFRMFREAKVECYPGINVQMRFHSEQTGRKAVEHNQECDELWLRMLSELEEEEMIDLDGSVRHFYDRTAEYLKKYTKYELAQTYTLQKRNERIAITPDGEIQYAIPSTMSTDGAKALLRRALYNVQNEGINETFRKIKTKLLNQ